MMITCKEQHRKSHAVSENLFIKLRHVSSILTIMNTLH